MNEYPEISEYSLEVGIPESEITGRSRRQDVVIAREVYWYILSLHKMTCSEIVKLMNDGRVHQTIAHGISNIQGLIDVNHTLILPYLKIIEKFSR